MWEVDVPRFLDGEKFIFKGDGAYGSGITLLGGVVFLTDKRVIFKSRGTIMIQSDEYFVYLENVVEMKVSKTPIQIPNGFILIDKSGKKHRFIVQKRKHWMELVEEQLKAIKST